MNRFATTLAATTLVAATLVATGVASPSRAATYDSLSAFSADPLAAGLVSEDFEAATLSGDVISFAGGTLTCLPATGTLCPATTSGTSFFGLNLTGPTGQQIDDATLSGVNAPYFSTPDGVRFTFGSAITAFGVFIGDLGDFGTGTTLAGSLSTGEAFTVVTNGALPQGSDPEDIFTGNTRFFGITSATPFTTITFTTAGTAGDGIFFDDLVYGTARVDVGDDDADPTDPSVVPLPASALLLLAGIGGLAALRRRRGA